MVDNKNCNGGNSTKSPEISQIFTEKLKIKFLHFKSRITGFAMNISIQIQVCRACLKPPEATKLAEYSLDSDIMKNYYNLLYYENAEVKFLFIDFFSLDKLIRLLSITIISF